MIPSRNQDQQDQVLPSIQAAAAERALRAAAGNDIEWKAALERYLVVRKISLGAAITEIENLSGALTRTKRRVDVLAQVNDQLGDDLEFYQEKLAERRVEIKAARAAARDVQMWASRDGQAARAANHILEQLPDPDLEDDEEPIDEVHAECTGVHFGHNGVTNCEGDPL